MRILYVCSYYKPAIVYGGPVTAVGPLLEAITKLGVEVTVLTTNANGKERLEVPVGKSIMIEGVQVFYFPLSDRVPSNYFFSPELVENAFDIMRFYDLVIIDGLWGHAFRPILRFANKIKLPSVIILHGQLMSWALKNKKIKKQLILNLFLKPAINKAKAIHCASSQEQKDLLELNLKPKSFVVPFGISSDKYLVMPPRGFLRERFGLRENDKILLQLGRIHEVKRPQFAIETLALIARKDVHLVIGGPDEKNLKKGLQYEAKQLGCDKNLHFTGILSQYDVQRSLADTDILIMPSILESFGMVAVEAMAAGVPVIVSEAVPVGQWVVEFGAGFQISGSTKRWKKAVCELIENEDHMHSMGKLGRALVFKEFDNNIVALRMLEQFSSLIEKVKGY